MYQEVKLFGKNKDGLYQGRIEQIMSGDGLKLFGRKIFKDKPDLLCISNRHDPAWVLSIFTGYRQIGTFEVERAHNFKEGEDVIVKVKDDKIVEVSVNSPKG